MASSSDIRAGRAFVELYADDKLLQQGLRGAQARISAFGQSASSIFAATRTPLESMVAQFNAAQKNVGDLFKDGQIDVQTYHRSLEVLAAEFDKIRAAARSVGTEVQGWGPAMAAAQRINATIGRDMGAVGGVSAAMQANRNQVVNEAAARRWAVGEITSLQAGRQAAGGSGLGRYGAFAANKLIGPAAALLAGRAVGAEAEEVALGQKESAFGRDAIEPLQRTATLSMAIGQAWDNVKQAMGVAIGKLGEWTHILPRIVEQTKEQADAAERTAAAVARNLKVSEDIPRIRDETKFFFEPDKDIKIHAEQLRREGIAESVIDAKVAALTEKRNLERGADEVEFYRLAEEESNTKIRAQEEALGKAEVEFYRLAEEESNIKIRAQEEAKQREEVELYRLAEEESREREFNRDEALSRSLRESTLTPAEQIARRRGEAADLHARKLLDDETFRRVNEQLDRLAEGFEKVDRAVQRLPDALAIGTQGAAESILRAQFGGSNQNLDQEQLSEQRSSRQALERIDRNIRNAPVLRAVSA